MTSVSLTCHTAHGLQLPAWGLCLGELVVRSWGNSRWERGCGWGWEFLVPGDSLTSSSSEAAPKQKAEQGRLSLKPQSFDRARLGHLSLLWSCRQTPSRNIVPLGNARFGRPSKQALFQILTSVSLACHAAHRLQLPSWGLHLDLLAAAATADIRYAAAAAN